MSSILVVLKFSSEEEFSQVPSKMLFSSTVSREMGSNFSPRSLYVLGMCSRIRIHEIQRMVDRQVMISFIREAIICSPTIRSNCGVRFNFFFNYGQQCVFSSIGNSNDEQIFRFAFEPAKNPLSLNNSPPIILSFPQFSFIIFNSFTFTAQFWLTIFE